MGQKIGNLTGKNKSTHQTPFAALLCFFINDLGLCMVTPEEEEVALQKLFSERAFSDLEIVPVQQSS
jgi:hypothetical protein